RLDARMERDLFKLLAEDTHRSAIPARPHNVRVVFGRHGIVTFGDFDMPITSDFALSLLVLGESLQRQGLQRRTFDFKKQLAYVLFRGAMDSRVSDVTLPMNQVLILLRQTVK